MTREVVRNRNASRRARWTPVAVLLLAFTGLTARPAHAQFAVVDVGAIAQLIQEASVLEKQLQTAQSELAQAQSEYAALTGSRGMQPLLSGINRNYLPANATQLQQVLAGTSGPYAALAQAVLTLVNASAVLTTNDLNALSPTERAVVLSGRQNSALLAASSQQALGTAGARFADLQLLINAMSSAQDPKGTLDLQARIAAEQAMLANEAVKLGQLRQVIDGQRFMADQQKSEQAVADVGSLRTLTPLTLP